MVLSFAGIFWFNTISNKVFDYKMQIFILMRHLKDIYSRRFTWMALLLLEILVQYQYNQYNKFSDHKMQIGSWLNLMDNFINNKCVTNIYCLSSILVIKLFCSLFFGVGKAERGLKTQKIRLMTRMIELIF